VTAHVRDITLTGDAVAALLRLAHHGKGGVLVDLEGRKGIGNKENIHGVLGMGVRLDGAECGKGAWRTGPYCCTNSATAPAAAEVRMTKLPRCNFNSH
jgi:hypothetical protein